MIITSWRLKTYDRKAGSNRSGRTRKTRWESYFPRLEALEDRLVPDAVHWAAAANGYWDDASNWDVGRVPTINDDVFISATGADYHVRVAAGADQDVSIASLTLSSPNADLQVNRSVNVNGPTLFSAGSVSTDKTDWTTSQLENRTHFDVGDCHIRTPTFTQT
jgi:hypothetical protein